MTSMDRYYADTFDADGKHYVFDQLSQGDECAGPFDSIEAAQVEAGRLNRQELHRREPGWGDVSVGDTVTSKGRHGAGQPAIRGELIRIEAGATGVVRTVLGLERHRSLSNLRRLA